MHHLGTCKTKTYSNEFAVAVPRNESTYTRLAICTKYSIANRVHMTQPWEPKTRAGPNHGVENGHLEQLLKEVAMVHKPKPFIIR
jgi:hypothetical protein